MRWRRGGRPGYPHTRRAYPHTFDGYPHPHQHAAAGPVSELGTTAERFGELLVDAGGGLSPGELAATAGLGERATSKALGQLRAAGLVDGPPKAPKLTPTGWARFGIAQPVGAGGELDDALTLWTDVGLYAHRAFLELLLSAIVARRHLTDPATVHLGFMALGETGTGKTAVATMVCELLGLDRVDAVILLDSAPRGRLVGRTERQAGEAGHVFVPPELARLPFVLLDEYDKADKEQRDAAYQLLQGTGTLAGEGGVRWRVPTTMLGANPPLRGDRLGQLRHEYRRRSAVLDTGYATGRRAELSQALSRWTPPMFPLDLDAFDVAPRLPAGGWTVLHSLPGQLTPDGQAVELRALASASLGRAALLGADPADELALTLATWATCVSYLSVTQSTPGLVRDGWQASVAALRAHLGPGFDLIDLERAARDAQLGQQQHQQAARRARVARDAVDVELVGARGELSARLEQARKSIEQLPSELRPRGQGVRDQLKHLRERAGQVRSAAALADVEQTAAGPLSAAEQIRREAAAAKDAAARARTQDAELRRQDELRQRQHAAEQKRLRAAADVERRAQLDEVAAAVDELERLYRRKKTQTGEQPLRVLAAHQAGQIRLLEFEPPQQAPARGLARLFDAAAPGIWRSPADPSIAFLGSSSRCTALAEWGPNTQAVIAPVLADLQQLEAALRDALGRKPRKRLALSPASAPARPALPWRRA